MTPALKLLLCAPLLLGASHAEASQRPLLATAAATPAPILPRECSGLGCWKNLLFKRESNEKYDFIPPPRINQSLPRVDGRNERWQMTKSFLVPPMDPTKCPSNKKTKINGDPGWEGVCNNPCVRQYMTPVVKNVVHYSGIKKCKPTTVPITYTDAHWGDTYGDRIPQEKWFSIASIDVSYAYKPEHCNRTRSSKTRKTGKTSSTSKHRRAMITAPVTATVGPYKEETHTMPLRLSGHERGLPAPESSDAGASFSPSPVDSAPTGCLSKRRANRKGQSKKPRRPECTDYTSCFYRCEKMKDREESVSTAVILFVIISLASFVAIIIGRKVYKKVRDRRGRGRGRGREVSGESGNAGPQTEEVVEVVEVEPRPEEQPVREKKDVDVPTVIVEEPTPTHPRSMDGASNDEIQHEDRGRLRVTRASGSDVYGSESSARLRHE